MVDINNRQQAIVAQVALDVGKLSVQELKHTKKNNEEHLKDRTMSPTASVASTQPTAKEALAGDEEPGIISTPPPSKRETWKRKARTNEESQSRRTDTLTTQCTMLGAPCEREEEDSWSLLPPAKRTIMLVPSLEESLGEDFLL
jgi:hypothetical protein